MRTVGVIPARLQSSRLPRKLLLADTGRPLLQYAWEAACRAKSLDDVLIATDSPEIAEAVRAFGGRCELTGEHPSGTDRVAEVARRCLPDAAVLVNIQGDEPEIEPGHIDALVSALKESPHSEMATLCTPIVSLEDRDDPNCTKVVCAADGRALYFSRAAIPFVRDGVGQGARGKGQEPDASGAVGQGTRGKGQGPDAGVDRQSTSGSPFSRDPESSEGSAATVSEFSSPWNLHLGLYAYRREFLMRLTALPPSPLEQLEKLEQLRALEMGARIQVARVSHRCAGIDTPTDYARFVARQRARQRFAA